MPLSALVPAPVKNTICFINRLLSVLKYIILQQITFMVIDHQALAYVESFLSPQRLEKFHKVLHSVRVILRVATEDVYQLHNTSAVIRSCDVFGYKMFIL